MLEKIKGLDEAAKKELDAVVDLSGLQHLKVKYLGRKGELTTILKSMGSLTPDEKPVIGKVINDLKVSLTALIEDKSKVLSESELQNQLSQEKIDVTVPARGILPGHSHPLTMMNDEIVRVFKGLGFSTYEGPEVETDYYNFEALNMPANHPARDMHDTFYVKGGKLLRTHTSTVQIHVMKNQSPPVYMIAPGAVYRRDNDLSHSPMFYQVEGLMVDRNISFGDLKGILSTFCREVFGTKLKVRFRPSFFPFTEPSAELDISCVICDGKGCQVCKQSGWIEVLGCGMVDPEVFKAVGYDSNMVQGFAFGMGVDRFAMLKYKINNIRLFYENDLRFLEQF
ncbi:MAG: phenylalanine--tRNA ligase subunit alpha [Pseudomonadota bacterium]